MAVSIDQSKISTLLIFSNIQFFSKMKPGRTQIFPSDLILILSSELWQNANRILLSDGYKAFALFVGNSVMNDFSVF